MTSWFTQTGQGTRMILAKVGSSDGLLNLYVGANHKVNLAVRNGAGVYTAIITTDETVGENEWNFVAVKWQYSGSTLTCTLYFNSKAYTADVTDFKDFTGIQTAIGGTVNGIYPLNGLSKKFSYSSLALSENEILSMYYKNIVRYDYDALGRINSKTTYTGLFSYKSEYTYISGTVANSATSKVASIKNNNGAPIIYEYDYNGNITKITQGLVSIIYYYNKLNELIQEDNQVLNKTIIYSFDEGGNLMSKLEIPYGVVGRTTIAYEYDSIWKDKLLKYNGKPITYDAIGNPLSYDGYTYTWEEGRQLKSIIGNSKNISFKYNDAGIRTEKNVYGVTTKYTLLGNRVTYETNGTDIIYYTYDDSSNLVSMNLNGIEYYYIRNAQGDIIGLFDKNGTQVVSYIYDSWGKVISTTGTLASTVGVKNLYRYRGYRYDMETGLYYLNSRYYNPEWGRFINADAAGGTIGELLSHNVFAYCLNNPVNMEDPSGYKFTWLKWVGVAAAVVAIVVIAVAAPAVIPAIATAVSNAYYATGAAVTVAGWRVMSAVSNVARGTPASAATINGVQKAVQTYYPPNNGALGAVTRKYLMTGDKIDRIGKLGGKYFAPVGTPMQMRALPPNADLSQYRIFEVVKPFEVESSTIASAFNQIGLGLQFRSAVSAETLLKRGIIKIFE